MTVSPQYFILYVKNQFIVNNLSYTGMNNVSISSMNPSLAFAVLKSVNTAETLIPIVTSVLAALRDKNSQKVE